jgi:hypothetical protein
MSAVSDSKHVVIIHGTWFNGDIFGDARREFEARGYAVHTRHAGLVAATRHPQRESSRPIRDDPSLLRALPAAAAMDRAVVSDDVEDVPPVRHQHHRRAACAATSTPSWSVNLAGLTARWGTGSSTPIGPPGSTSRRHHPRARDRRTTGPAGASPRRTGDRETVCERGVCRDSRIRPPGVSRQRATRHDESHRRVDGRASHPDRRLSVEKAELPVAS